MRREAILTGVFREIHRGSPSASQSPSGFCHCNVATYCLMYSRRRRVHCSGSVTVFSGFIASSKTGCWGKTGTTGPYTGPKYSPPKTVEKRGAYGVSVPGSGTKSLPLPGPRSRPGSQPSAWSRSISRRDRSLHECRWHDLEEPPRAMPGPDPVFDRDRGVAGDEPEPCEIVLVILCKFRNRCKNFRCEHDARECDRDLRNDRDIEDSFRSTHRQLDQATGLRDRDRICQYPVRARKGSGEEKLFADVTPFPIIILRWG